MLRTCVHVIYHRTPHGRLPTQWDTGSFVGKTLHNSCSYQGDEIIVNPAFDSGDFDVPTTPDMLVEVSDSKGQRQYRVAGDGTTLIDISGLAAGDLGSGDGGLRSLRWLVIGGFLSAIAVGVGLYYR